MFKQWKQFTFAALAVLCLFTLSALPAQADDNPNPQVTQHSTWGAVKIIYRGSLSITPEQPPTQQSLRGKVGMMAASVNWGNNIVSEAFYALDPSRSGTSNKVYQGCAMGDWPYPWQGDCCGALARVSQLAEGGAPNASCLGTWNGYQQLWWCKFGVDLILYRSSYGYPGGHLFLPSGYYYAPNSWQSAQPGWVIQAPPVSGVHSAHTAIVIINGGSWLDVIDCNWVGTGGMPSAPIFHYLLARHKIDSATLNSYGFKAYCPWQNPYLVQ